MQESSTGKRVLLRLKPGIEEEPGAEMFRAFGDPALARPELLLLDATEFYASEPEASFSADCPLTSRSRRMRSRLIGAAPRGHRSGMEPARS